jgi:hypothetical protein
MQSEILDEQETFDAHPSYLEVLRWWERRRLWFTFVVLASQILSLSSMWDAVERYGAVLAIFQSFFYLIAANCCYCVGWGSEFLVRYYLNGTSLGRSTWLLMFIVGTLFSAVITMLSYTFALEVI